jgi:hypothetical protein
MKNWLFVVVLGLLSLGLAQAQEKEQGAYGPFFVSGIIKQNDTTNVKLLQGIVVSDSPANARLVFTGMASKQNPGWSVVEVLASTFSQLYTTLPSSTQSEMKPITKGVGI